MFVIFVIKDIFYKAVTQMNFFLRKIIHKTVKNNQNRYLLHFRGNVEKNMLY